MMYIIETARMYLRPFTPADLDDYYGQVYSDPDVMVYLPGGVPRTREKTNEVLEFSMQHGQEHGFTLWAAIDKASGQFMGHCGLVYLKGTPDVEVAYAFGKAFWGQGIATEAAGAALRYGFEVAGLDYIVVLAEPGNLASQRVMQKIGMFHQGMTNQYYHTPLVLYRLERSQWQPDAALFVVRKAG